MNRYFLISVFVLACFFFMVNKSYAWDPFQIYISNWHRCTPLNAYKDGCSEDFTAFVIQGGPAEEEEWEWDWPSGAYDTGEAGFSYYSTGHCKFNATGVYDVWATGYDEDWPQSDYDWARIHVFEMKLDIDGVSDDDEEDPGGYICVNDDDLVEIYLSYQPPLHLMPRYGKVELSASSSNIKVWSSPDKETLVIPDGSNLYKRWYSPPSTLYVEGCSPGEALLYLRYMYGSTYPGGEYNPDIVKFTVINADIDVDSNRNGIVDCTEDEDSLEEQKSAIVPVNIDDDDNCERDVENNCIDCQSDLDDLVQVVIAGVPSGWTATLSVASEEDADKFKLFNGNDYWQEGDDSWYPGQQNPDYSYPILGNRSQYTTVSSYQIPDPTIDHTYYMEALEFRSSTSDNWTLKLTVTNGTLTFEDRVILRPSPFILLPGSASTKAVYAPDYVGKENPDEDSKIEVLGSTVDVSDDSPYYRDPWLQDEIEIGYTSWPGGQMWVVLDLPRDGELDDWPENDLLGQDYGHFNYNYGSEYGDEGGNIEATPPVYYNGEDRPFGIVVVGSGCSIGPFIEAQGSIQPVLSCSTGWLQVGHIDEVVSFLGSDNVRIADNDLGISLIEQFDNNSTEDSGTTDVGNANYLQDTTKNWDPNFWADGCIKITNTRTNAVEVRQIMSNDTTKITVYDSQQGKGKSWDSFPGGDTWDYMLVARSEYRAMFFDDEEDFGVVSQVNGTTIFDLTNTKNWSSNKWQNGYIMVFSPPDAGTLDIVKTKLIQSSGSNSITISGSWGSQSPDETSPYVLVHESKMDDAYDYVYFGQSYMDSLACDTVRRVWALNRNFQVYQDDINDVNKALTNTWGGPFSANAFTKIPVLFKPGEEGAIALVPNMVNLLNLDGDLTMSKPFGPRDDTGDVFEQSASGSFVDAWPLHCGCGEIHCGTNVKRKIPSLNWWDYYE